MLANTVTICVIIKCYQRLILSNVYNNLPHLFSTEFTSEPEALPERPDRKTSDGEAEVGYGVQGLPGVCGWVHEYAGENDFNVLFALSQHECLISTHYVKHEKL